MTKKKNTPRISRIKQFAQYMVSGGAYFWSGYAVFFVCDHLLHWHLWWAKLTANMAGWTIYYLLQRYWVFNNPSLKKKQTQVTERYVVLTAANFVIDYSIIRALKAAGLTPYLGQFISAGFFTGWNYLWSRYWVFPETKTASRKASKP